MYKKGGGERGGEDSCSVRKKHDAKSEVEMRKTKVRRKKKTNSNREDGNPRLFCYRRKWESGLIARAKTGRESERAQKRERGDSKKKTFLGSARSGKLVILRTDDAFDGTIRTDRSDLMDR